MSIENNGKDRIGCHAHMVVCGMSNSHFETLRVKLRNAFTIDHKIYGKQAAVYVSKKDMSTLKIGYSYFLGKLREPENRNVNTRKINFKPSFICNDHTLTSVQFKKLLMDPKTITAMKDYNQFIHGLKY
jgi:hypothetical protein